MRHERVHLRQPSKDGMRLGLLTLALLLVVRIIWLPAHLSHEDHLAAGAAHAAGHSHRGHDHRHHRGHGHDHDHGDRKNTDEERDDEDHEPHPALDHAFDLLTPSSVGADGVAPVLAVANPACIDLRALLERTLDAGPEPLPPQARPPDARRPRAPPNAT